MDIWIQSGKSVSKAGADSASRTGTPCFIHRRNFSFCGGKKERNYTVSFIRGCFQFTLRSGISPCADHRKKTSVPKTWIGISQSTSTGQKKRVGVGGPVVFRRRKLLSGIQHLPGIPAQTGHADYPVYYESGVRRLERPPARTNPAVPAVRGRRLHTVNPSKPCLL